VLFLAAFPVAVFLGLSGDAIVRLVYGPSAVREAGVVLQLFAATVFVRFTVDAFALMLTTAERQIVRLWIVLGGTILNLALNAAIIPTHGAIGAAVVSLVTNAAVGAAYLLWSGMPVARWLGGRRTLAVVGVTAGVVSAAVVLTTPVPLVVGLGSALACGGAALFWGLKPAERSLLRAGAIPGWSRA
jgi:O-antigen/teichoic acid export membrane protein